MPYFWGPRLLAMPPSTTTDDLKDDSANYTSAYAVQAFASSGDPILGLQHLLSVLVRFGYSPALLVSHTSPARLLYNSEITLTASTLAKFDWAIYGCNSSHFASTIHSHSMRFNIILACNAFANGPTLFKEVCLCPTTL
jgi:hypothetical protein